MVHDRFTVKKKGNNENDETLIKYGAQGGIEPPTQGFSVLFVLLITILYPFK